MPSWEAVSLRASIGERVAPGGSRSTCLPPGSHLHPLEDAWQGSGFPVEEED